jgi:hypothetical protein
MRGPRYARLNHQFDRDLLLAEIDKIPRYQFRTIAATRFDISAVPYKFDLGSPFEIVEQEVLEQSTYTRWDGDQKLLVEGPIATYTHCCFTHPPDRANMLYQDNILADIEGVGQRYIRPYIPFSDQAWSWREDFDLRALRIELERLPFEYILRARAIVLWEGDHLGNVHRDSVPGFTHPWMDKGFGVININLLDGGSVLKLKVDEQIVEVNDPCFTFDESQYHGSTRGTEKRIQLNVVGKFDPDRLAALLDVPPVE